MPGAMRPAHPGGRPAGRPPAGGPGLGLLAAGAGRRPLRAAVGPARPGPGEFLEPRLPALRHRVAAPASIRRRPSHVDGVAGQHRYPGRRHRIRPRPCDHAAGATPRRQCRGPDAQRRQPRRRPTLHRGDPGGPRLRRTVGRAVSHRPAAHRRRQRGRAGARPSHAQSARDHAPPRAATRRGSRAGFPRAKSRRFPPSARRPRAC